MINSSGIGVYLRGVLPILIKSCNNFILIGNQELLQSYLSENVKIIDCNVKPFSVKDTFIFPSVILKQINKTDTYFTPFFNVPNGIKIPVYTAIHDIVFPDIPELLSKTGLAARMWFFKRAYNKSKKIFTVSQFSKSRIEYHLGTSKPVIVTLNAIQQIYLDYHEKLKNIQKKETIVFIGNIKKHKGLIYLLDAFHLARKEGLPHKLIIIGSKENFRTSDMNIMNKIESIDADAVSFTGFISDDTLIEHLASASLLVQPSLYEGFCLPPLEALVLGTNVLLSDIPVLKEIYADFPVSFFHAGDSNDLKKKLMELLYKKEASTAVLSNELLLKYTFEKTTSCILKEFE